VKARVAVLGAGSFGTAMANVLARNEPVVLWGRNTETMERAARDRQCAGQELLHGIEVNPNLKQVAECDILLPILPSHAFEEVTRMLLPYLRSNHMLVHGTKGLDPNYPNGFRTMSGLLRDLTGLDRIGCLAGPNLAREIAEGKPAATVVASAHEDVLNTLPDLLRGPRFQVLISDDLKGIELSGVLKNIMAIAAGTHYELGLGENAKALLVNRALVEMIHLGLQMGAALKSFLGVAGIGDLMATCSSLNSRNFTVGRYLAQGLSLEQIQAVMEESAEGINTTRVVHRLAVEAGWKAPITRMVYRVLFEGLSPVEAMDILMKVPLREDIDFI
jgi:glycerol-3-phosphate dehydrogenase (NAD(P)+)